MRDELPLRGGGVVLRAFELGDLEAYARWLEPGHEWSRFDGPYYPPLSAEAIATRLEEHRERLRTGDPPGRPPPRIVIADPDRDELIGTLCWYWISRETHWPALGIALYDPAHWGRGLGFAALGLWSDWLFSIGPEFARLDLRTWSGNHGMIRLAEKLGYQLEARFRDARVVDGELHDSLGFGVLRREWETLYPDGFAAQLRTE